MEIKKFLISSIKRLLLDIEFIENVEKTNNILDSHDDYLLQCEQIKSKLQALLDYNFYPSEVDGVEPYTVEIRVVDSEA